MKASKPDLIRTVSISAVVLCTAVGMNSVQASSSNISTKEVVLKGNALIKKGKYNEAQDLFSKFAKKRPRNSVLSYYLGLSYIYSKQTKKALSPLAKTVVMSDPNSTIHKRASNLLVKYHGVKPYSCLQRYLKPPKLVRWNKNKMPLLIYVSDGKQLPQVFDDYDLSPAEVVMVGSWARNRSFISQLKTSRLYKPAYKKGVINGIESWRWAMKERIISYKLTTDPSKADIVVFWCNKIPGYSGWTYYPMIYPGKAYPCVIFLSLEKSKVPTAVFCEVVKWTCAHELGHAYGLEHSPSKKDIMTPKWKHPLFLVKPDGSLYKPKGVSYSLFSQSDKTTFRALYSIPGDVIFPSVSQQ